MRNAILITSLALGVSSSACVSYSGVTKADGQLYISGGTSYFVYTAPWVRRCDLDGNQLRCEELAESPSAPRARQETAPAAKPAAAAPETHNTAAPAAAPKKSP